MPDYLAPGVYIEEVEFGSRVIEGVSTSTAGFVGETERGPTRTTLVGSWTDYVRRYGGFIDQPPSNRAHHFLPYGVRGFFENGGQRLVIARITARSAQTAAVTLVCQPGAVQLRAASWHWRHSKE
jgi:phage tail sheath protein FI